MADVRRIDVARATGLAAIVGMVGLVSGWAPRIAGADDAAKHKGSSTTIRLAEGALTLKAPKSWEKRQPRFRIIEYEFAVQPPEGKGDAGRVTIMGAGGSVAANIDRWKGQFAKVARSEEEEFNVGKVKVRVVDLEGTFRERRGGPFSGAPAKLRSDYRMLGAIIVTPNKGQYFIKITGPKATLAKQKDALKEMLKKLQFQG